VLGVCLAQGKQQCARPTDILQTSGVIDSAVDGPTVSETCFQPAARASSGLGTTVRNPALIPREVCWAKRERLGISPKAGMWSDRDGMHAPDEDEDEV
jgi:hypothetical protein